jgi:ThiF family/Prokaryotic homologs of the JAB domain
MAIKLRLTGHQHSRLRGHLLPGDNLEAVALVACGRATRAESVTLCVRYVFSVPYDQCSVRSADRVTWSTECVLPFLDRAAKERLAILKIHSHPGGYDRFSETDDESDGNFFQSVYGWMDSDDPHASAIMLPSGRIIARRVGSDGSFAPFDSVVVAGDDIRVWQDDSSGRTNRPDFALRHEQLFGPGTTGQLRALAIGIVGCSGTGSPLIEMLARLGVGRLVLVDPDKVEEKNLNRIYNATREDAILRRHKTEVMGRAVARMGLGTEVQLVTADLATREAILALSECDIVFGCMDGARGRALLNRMATFYSLPYFDIGVGLEADGNGGISEAVGAVHYVQPDTSNLRERGVYSIAQQQAESELRTDPATYAQKVKASYIQGVRVDRPAVISINTQMAAVAVNELLARLHRFRISENRDFAEVRTAFLHGEQYHEADNRSVPSSSRDVGRGDVEPLLNTPELSLPQ